MLISENKPRTRQFHLQQEHSDPDYGSCLWATVTFDLDRYSMTAESDCGNYSYCWTPTPGSESFLRLMCRVSEDYLLGKISSRSCFDLEESKKRTISAFSGELSDELCEEIMEIDTCGEEMFFRECEAILRAGGFSDTFETIDCVKEYPRGAAKFAEIFCQCLQPYLRVLVKEEEAGEAMRTPSPENKALTVEELREMDGEPVWCAKESAYVFASTIIDEPYIQVYYFTNKGTCGTVLYYHTKFYRRPPEKRE